MVGVWACSNGYRNRKGVRDGLSGLGVGKWGVGREARVWGLLGSLLCFLPSLTVP